MVRSFSHGMIDAWRRQVAWITLEEGIILLAALGDFDEDKIVVRVSAGYYTIQVRALLEHYSPSEYCINIRPVYFTGGPIEKRYKGTLLTLLLDRILLMSHEKGCAFALRTVKYARGFGSTNNIKGNSARNLAYCI